MEPWRVSLAGGIWLLLLYSLSVAFVVGSGGSHSNGLLRFWAEVLPAMGSETNRRVAAGFPLAFLYGLGGAWLFALIYNLLPARLQAGPEPS